MLEINSWHFERRRQARLHFSSEGWLGYRKSYLSGNHYWCGTRHRSAFASRPPVFFTSARIFHSYASKGSNRSVFQSFVFLIVYAEINLEPRPFNLFLTPSVLNWPLRKHSQIQKNKAMYAYGESWNFGVSVALDYFWHDWPGWNQLFYNLSNFG